jgi:hypothetical protein
VVATFAFYTVPIQDMRAALAFTNYCPSSQDVHPLLENLAWAKQSSYCRRSPFSEELSIMLKL